MRLEPMLSDAISIASVGIVGEKEEIEVELGSNLELGRMAVAPRELGNSSPAVGPDTPAVVFAAERPVDLKAETCPLILVELDELRLGVECLSLPNFENRLREAPPVLG